MEKESLYITATMAFEEITLNLPWGRLAAKAWGPRDGRRVLALHGWLDNASSFDGVAPSLPGLRLVALDLPGHGHSDPIPQGMAYHFIDAVMNVSLALDALGWDRCSLLGHSLGGAISSVLAGTEPHRFERVALIEALGPFTAEPPDSPQRLKTFLTEWRAISQKRKPVYPTLESAIAARLKVGGLTEGAARTLAARGTAQVEGGYTWRSDIRLRLPTPLRLTEGHVHAFLSRVECPVLVLWGTRGLQLATDFLETRSSNVRDLRVERVEGGHHMHLDTPEIAAPHLAAFFA